MTTTAPASIARFIVGEFYECRSACDSDCFWTFEVLARTAKFITITDGDKIRRVGVYVYEGVESALPLGKYSMAPVLRASAWS